MKGNELAEDVGTLNNSPVWLYCVRRETQLLRNRKCVQFVGGFGVPDRLWLTRCTSRQYKVPRHPRLSSNASWKRSNCDENLAIIRRDDDISLRGCGNRSNLAATEQSSQFQRGSNAAPDGRHGPGAFGAVELIAVVQTDARREWQLRKRHVDADRFDAGRLRAAVFRIGRVAIIGTESRGGAGALGPLVQE